MSYLISLKKSCHAVMRKTQCHNLMNREYMSHCDKQN